jgi:DNA-binding IclR family transcriptional regulator
MLSGIYEAPEKVKILSHVACHDTFKINQVSKETGITKCLVFRYLGYLKDIGLISREGRLYRLQDNSKSMAVKVLLNLERMDLRVFLKTHLLGS